MNRKTVLNLFLILTSILLLPDFSQGAGEDVLFVAQQYGFKPVKVVSSPVIWLEGTAEKNNLIDISNMEDFANLKVKDNFKDLFDPKADSFTDDCLYIDISIWTVGTSYPVAYHIEIQMGTQDNYPYSTAFLGYCSSDVLVEQVKKNVESLIEENALVFYKSRGELPPF